MKYRGLAYYPEYWPEERWDEDIRLMLDANVNIVRIGEFAWTRMEPAEGKFTLNWLHRIVEKLGAAGIDVMLSTPTATPPAWLTSAHPDTLVVTEDGVRLRHGRRRHGCPLSKTYRRHTERIVDRLTREFSKYQNVVAWQIDNEVGSETGFCHCPACEEAFRQWLRDRYGTIEELNRRWGTGFWSMDYCDWDQIRLGKAGSDYPSHVLDCRRFWSWSFIDFVRHQVEIIRKNHPSANVNTNMMGPIYPEINYFDLAPHIDVAPDDLYFDIGPMDVSAFACNIFRSYKPGRAFWLAETGTTALKPGKNPLHAQFRAWAWHAIARGNEAHFIFRWRTCPSGQEQELYGVLECSGLPGRKHKAVKEMFAEFARLGPELQAAPLPKADVALILDYDVVWGYDSSFIAEQMQYNAHVYKMHEFLYHRNVLADIIPPARDLSEYKAVILPSVAMVDADFADRLREFVRSGGVVLATPQLACRDRNNNYITARPPVGLNDLFGLSVEGGTFLNSAAGPDEGIWRPAPNWRDVEVRVRLDAPGAAAEGKAVRWMEEVTLAGGKAIATFEEDQYEGCPAVVENRIGSGTAIYAAAYFDDALTDALIGRALDAAGIEAFPETPRWVEIVQRGSLTFLINNLSRPVEVKLPLPDAEALLGDYSCGVCRLEPFGVCVLKSDK
ncbi:MAG: beta-galactosidase [Planctomycetia bacterium]|nr:beta-galactosidase [Planctomycetia bacterium]